jgi:hypothetical protein
MFVLIDLFAQSILLLVNGLLLRGRQGATVGLHVGALAGLNGLALLGELLSLRLRQLAIFDSLIDTLLLIAIALIHFRAAGMRLFKIFGVGGEGAQS